VFKFLEKQTAERCTIVIGNTSTLFNIQHFKIIIQQRVAGHGQQTHPVQQSALILSQITTPTLRLTSSRQGSSLPGHLEDDLQDQREADVRYQRDDDQKEGENDQKEGENDQKNERTTKTNAKTSKATEAGISEAKQAADVDEVDV